MSIVAIVINKALFRHFALGVTIPVGGSKLVEPGERWAMDLRNDFEDEYEIVLRVARVGKRWDFSSSVSLPDGSSTSV
jgi:hypothetical protein